MNGWLNPNVGEPVSIDLTSGVLAVHEFFETPHRTLILKLESDQRTTGDRFLVCVGCKDKPSSPMSYDTLLCKRLDAQTLLVVTDQFESVVKCYASRLFDYEGLQHWMGEDDDTPDDKTCNTKR
jgi:hypothetical protein